jgi:hypothetical protein
MTQQPFTAGGRRFFSGERFVLLGSALGHCEVSGRLLVTRRFDLMQGPAHGVSRTKALLRTEKILLGERAEGRGVLFGELAPRRFEGVMAGSSQVAGSLLVRKRFTGWTTGRAIGTATPLVVKNLVGRGAGLAKPVAALRTEKVLGGPVIQGRGTTEATILVRKVLATSALGNARAVADLRVAKQLSAAFWGASEAAAALRAEKLLGARSSGSVSFLAALRTAKVLSGPTIDGVGSASGHLALLKQFAGMASGHAIAIAQMEPLLTYRRTEDDNVRTNEAGDVRQTERDVN